MKDWMMSDVMFEADILNPGLAVSPWCGHRNFIYDFIRHFEPQSIIELGTHYGCSFFAMAQSIKDNHLQSKLYAVDTWQGDEQAGYYGNEVWDLVNRTKETYYSQVEIHLNKMLFQEAVKWFNDETFDLIHIDGLHTYDAVSRDFSMWLPKLKKNGVMMFHDVNSKLKYGTNSFWKKIKEQYSYYFEFEHSWGLGILFPKGKELYDQMIDINFSDKQKIYMYKALYQYEIMKTKDLTSMANDRYEAIEKQSRMIDERDEVIRSQKKLIDEKDAGICRQIEMINERDAVIQAQKELVDEKDAGIRRQTEMIDERDETIRAQKKLIDEKDVGLQKQSRMIDERDETIRLQAVLLSEKEAIIAKQKIAIEEKEKALNIMNHILEKHKIISRIIRRGM